MTNSIKLFTILGKQVLNKSFSANGVYDVQLPELTTGVYIAQLESENGKISKKIVLE
ncbi:T9SS type A sorting domain-containing protein [Polaribacter sp. R77954]|uniref:T9SS type A sorting domain-containing protein n=1 Tax=Polaribacter sp. R77954 TaxID=3093870 RepID=UPI0037CC0F01